MEIGDKCKRKLTPIFFFFLVFKDRLNDTLKFTYEDKYFVYLEKATHVGSLTWDFSSVPKEPFTEIFLKVSD